MLSDSNFVLLLVSHLSCDATSLYEIQHLKMQCAHILFLIWPHGSAKIDVTRSRRCVPLVCDSETSTIIYYLVVVIYGNFYS